MLTMQCAKWSNFCYTNIDTAMFETGLKLKCFGEQYTNWNKTSLLFIACLKTKVNTYRPLYSHLVIKNQDMLLIQDTCVH